MKDKIADLLGQVEGMKAANAEEVEALRIKYLSKKGAITELFNEFREVPKEEKKELGQALNQLRQAAEGRINEMRERLSAVGAQAVDKQDLTRTPDTIELGTRHPLSLVREEIIDIFSRIGFTVAEGPEVEDDKHVYGLLNFPPEHPARDMQDTFFIEKEAGVQKPTDVLLRSHTSSVQTRVMTSQQPPIRVLCPGRVYRNEAISARAHCFFHQVEGLYVDKNVSFADLREVLLYFAKEMFGPETKIRLRPSYFPFTEPSAEMDISCDLCGGKGCSFCKGTGWVEILGCGMVDPNVLEACGIDSKVYSGYAFGLGVERITNLKYRVKDLRLFSENDVRFLRQFESC
ncbi:MAG: phenylalanine--tRNA ligase subunit alpha [Paludibacteraceae bacterium]